MKIKNLPSIFVLSIKPKEYLKQGLSHCGAYSVKGILSAYGKDNKKHPKEYHPHRIGKITGFTFGKDYYVKILRNYGLAAETGQAGHLPPREKINLLKSLLAKNSPVMIRIGNGFWSGKRFNYLLSKITPHWITLWGYNDTKKLFYVYDSGLSAEHYEKNIPIGNTTRKYSEILRDWNFGALHPTCLLIGTAVNYLYIRLISNTYSDPGSE